jgi:hypothetical protein
VREDRRFVFVQQLMGKELQTFLDYPPMQQAEEASKGTGQ